MTTPFVNEPISSLRAAASAESLPFWQSLLEMDLIPDWMIRRGIRSLVRSRLEEETKASGGSWHRHPEQPILGMTSQEYCEAATAPRSGARW